MDLVGEMQHEVALEARIERLGPRGVEGPVEHREGERETPVRRLLLYRDTSRIRKRLPLGPYSRRIPRALWWC